MGCPGWEVLGWVVEVVVVEWVDSRINSSSSNKINREVVVDFKVEVSAVPGRIVFPLTRNLASRVSNLLKVLEGVVEVGSSSSGRNLGVKGIVRNRWLLCSRNRWVVGEEGEEGGEVDGDVTVTIEILYAMVFEKDLVHPFLVEENPQISISRHNALTNHKK